MIWDQSLNAVGRGWPEHLEPRGERERLFLLFVRSRFEEWELGWGGDFGRRSSVYTAVKGIRVGRREVRKKSTCGDNWSGMSWSNPYVWQCQAR